MPYLYAIPEADALTGELLLEHDRAYTQEEFEALVRRCVGEAYPHGIRSLLRDGYPHLLELLFAEGFREPRVTARYHGKGMRDNG